MKRVTLTFPENFEFAVQTTPEEFEAQVRLMAALKMFELGKLSSGMAAQLAGMSRADFFEMCGRYRVPVFTYDEQEMAAELESDRDTVQRNSQ